jgi:hypothetical protein
MIATKNVFLFLPNIIGYFRYLFIFLTIFTFRSHPILTLLLGATS